MYQFIVIVLERNLAAFFFERVFASVARLGWKPPSKHRPPSPLSVCPPSSVSGAAAYFTPSLPRKFFTVAALWMTAPRASYHPGFALKPLALLPTELQLVPKNNPPLFLLPQNKPGCGGTPPLLSLGRHSRCLRVNPEALFGGARRSRR